VGKPEQHVIQIHTHDIKQNKSATVQTSKTYDLEQSTYVHVAILAQQLLGQVLDFAAKGARQVVHEHGLAFLERAVQEHLSRQCSAISVNGCAALESGLPGTTPQRVKHRNNAEACEPKETETKPGFVRDYLKRAGI